MWQDNKDISKGMRMFCEARISNGDFNGDGKIRG